MKKMVKQEITVDLVDNILPKGIKVDFALIDVEHLEIEVLESMKRVIANSPNIIMAIEWTGRTISA